jgi:hypothetical protein
LLKDVQVKRSRNSKAAWPSGAPRPGACALGEDRRARELAEAELADVRRFGGRRAFGVALRVAGLVRGGKDGLVMLEESVAVLSGSPAALERAWSLCRMGCRAAPRG